MVTRPYYLLSEAFECLGRHLYGPEWTSNEITAVQRKSPDETAAEIAGLRRSVAEIDTKLEQLAAEGKTLLTSERVAAIKAEKDALTTERLKTVEHHPGFWVPGWAEDLRRDAQTYQRKTVTETMLIEAIKAGKFRVEGVRQMLDPWVWKDRVICHHLELSVVLGPRSWGTHAMRFQPVRILEDGFDAWLKTVQPIVSTPAAESTLSPEEQCEQLFGEEVAKGIKRMTRDQYIVDAMNRIPGLSDRAARRAWSRIAKGIFKQRGAPKRENRSTRRK